MNQVAEEILMHYGMPRRSGRYPWGSGQDPYQHDSRDFLGRVEELRKQGFTYTDEKGKTWTGDTAIAKSLGLSTTQFRTEMRIANHEREATELATLRAMKEDGLSYTEIGRRMGMNESSVRSKLQSKSEARIKEAQKTADFIKQQIETKGMIDVGVGVERELNISKEMMNEALYILEREGYPVYKNMVEQNTNVGNFTTQKIICPKGTPYKDIYQHDQVHSLNDYISRDGGDTYEKKFHYPESLDSKRMKIRYNEEGGLERDGVIELRRGVADLSLGESHYSQVRIMVDGTHYLKGMAVYSDDMPPGVDVIFNTNKKVGTPMEKVLKEIKDDPDNPFGSAIKDADQGGQYWYTDKNGNKKLGLINKRADEGDWSDWKDALPSQFLSKQNKGLAKRQLDMAKEDKIAEFESYCELNNPTVKKHLLAKFADSCDAAAVDLQAAALPGQKYNVIIPVNSLKDNECYCPNYDNGTQLALIRYPHAGTFEIPIVTVNNKHAEANRLLGKDVKDAIGINSKVAERLSGADFDGDTVMCIPTNDGKTRITSTPKLKGLDGFDPKLQYGPETYAGKSVRLMKKENVQQEMGKISNLITDMTLQGAGPEKMERAVRHSMVVIDAYKHKLDFRQSALDNNIAALHKEYQGKSSGGAATIVSRAKGQASVLRRQGSPIIDPETGKVSYKLSDDLYYPVKNYDKSTKTMTLRTADGKKITYNVGDKDAVERYNPVKRKDPVTGEVTYTNKAGDITYKIKARTQKTTKMAKTDDAYTLVSQTRHPMELLYADYANSMKDLANKARKEMVNTGKIATSKAAKEIYKEEVRSLEYKLNEALKNAPRERAAQRMAGAEVSAKKKAGLITDKGDEKKARAKATTKYRQEVGAVARKARNITLTDREWEAIQAGAVSENTLKKILSNTDVDDLRQRATPRPKNTLSQAQIARIKNYRSSNYSNAEIAKKLGISPDSVAKYLEGVN